MSACDGIEKKVRLVAAATDMPWFLTDLGLTDDISRPVDQIAGGQRLGEISAQLLGDGFGQLDG